MQKKIDLFQISFTFLILLQNFFLLGSKCEIDFRRTLSPRTSSITKKITRM